MLPHESLRALGYTRLGKSRGGRQSWMAFPSGGRSPSLLQGGDFASQDKLSTALPSLPRQPLGTSGECQTKRGSPLAWGRGCTARSAWEGAKLILLCQAAAAQVRLCGSGTALGWVGAIRVVMPRHWGSPKGHKPGVRKDKEGRTSFGKEENG